MKNTFLSLLRHLLTAAGAAVIANNVRNHPELSVVDPVTVAGGLVTALGTLWGAVDEHVAEKAENLKR
jgi:hypothetical protein